MTLLDRVNRAKCSREDDPTQHDKKEPLWLRYVREQRRVRVDWGKAA